MKRDLDLIRHILLVIESSNKDLGPCDFLTDDYDIDAVKYHIQLLIDKDYIEALNTSDLIKTDFIVMRLMPSGHDYLDSVNDDDVWCKTKTKLGSLLSSATFEIIKTTALSIITAQLGT